MNPEYEQQLEAEIDRQLKDLPDLAAPTDLVARTMNAITRPAAPWHARPWYAWPTGLRAAYLILAIAALAGAFYGWRAVEPGLSGMVLARSAHWRAGLECLSNTVSALSGAIGPILDHFGKGIVLSCVLVVLLAYAACVGFGTVFVRLALSSSRKS